MRCRRRRAARGVPLKVLRLEPPDGLYCSKLVLIRPDQHIAWHGDAVSDAMSVIDRVARAASWGATWPFAKTASLLSGHTTRDAVPP